MFGSSRRLGMAIATIAACTIVHAWGAVLAQSASASSSTPGVGWMLTGRTFPTNLAPGGEGIIEVAVFNVGAASSSGPITVTDTLPPGVTATRAGELHNETLAWEDQEEREGLVPQERPIGHKLWACTGNGPGGVPRVEGATVITCTNTPELSSFAGGGGSTYRGVGVAEGPNFTPSVGIAVKVGAAVSEAEVHTNTAAIAGGGARSAASTTDPIAVGSTPPAFGFTGLDAWFSNADGSLDTQAGSHPYAFTFSFDLANVLVNHGFYVFPSGEEVRNIEAYLPPGFVGDPTAVPRCTAQALNAGTCPNDSQIGTARASVLGPTSLAFQVYNMVPPPGIPAEFAFSFVGVSTFLDSEVRSGGDYGITTDTNNIAQRQLMGFTITLWGVPSDPSHLIWRNNNSGGCSQAEIENTEPEFLNLCKPVNTGSKPLLTLPTACAGPQTVSVRANTWQHPETFVEKSLTLHDSNDDPAGFTGCEHLGFGPAITTSPDTRQADTPTGLTVEVKPPVGGLSDPEGLSTADIQNTTVTLPEGLVINPGQAAGLQACTETEATLKENNEAPVCPNASKVGTDEIDTPLLPKPLQGSVYIMQSDPPNLELLVAASGEGVNLKLVGKVHLNEQTGRLETKFEGTPELPFTNFKLSFSGGAQAALDTPTLCGAYTTNADFDPWSSPFVSDFLTTAGFGVTAGPGNSPCPSSPLPFAPSLTAGSTTDQAGGFTNFSLLLARGDGQQRISGLRFKAPEGLTGFLSKVPLCTNAQAEANACPEASKIGHTVVEAGPGPYPLIVPEPGQPPAPIYLTESYGGAPFGLAIVVPLRVGPFVLPTQRVRARIEVDPFTSALTVTTDPLPQVVGGVPTDLREIDAVIERPEFMVNPTNCTAQEFSGVASGTPPPGVGGPGASAVIASHFQVGACRSLEFTPKFSVSTSGKTSKANGASLTARVSYPDVPQGTQADIASVKVELPKQLPSRLTTLQKACTAAQFEANPAGCPPASFIGHARVLTPLLPVPLEGPAIFVSHGGEAFPSLTMVLQGDGVTVDLVGATFISKAGVTSTTFKTVPDDPFSTFELTLPQGPYSALAANGDLCASRLVMPSQFVGQNGAVLNRSTQVSVTGCAKKRALTRSQKLALALKACHKKKNRTKRKNCERAAHKRYGPTKAKKSKPKKG